MSLTQVEIVANQIETQRIGYQAISLTNYENTAEPQIAAGSVVEIGGALFEAAANESITGWGGISNNSDVYIKLTGSGASATASFTTTAPTWDTAKQSWYSGAERYIFALRKDGSGNYARKRILGPMPSRQLDQLYVDFAYLRDSWNPVDGATQLYAADLEKTTGSSSYTKVKEILMPFTGTVNVYFELHSGNVAATAYGRIYKNDVAVGTERSTTSISYQAYDEAISVTRGDKLGLYIKESGGVYFAYARYFRIRCDRDLSESIYKSLNQVIED